MQITGVTPIAPSGHQKSKNIGSINQDEQIRSIQFEIENVKKELQNLSVNKEISYEEKTVKRKELQLQLQNLNQELAQRRMQIQEERRAAAKAELQEVNQINTDNDERNGIITGTMQGLIGAEASLKYITTLKSVKTQMEGRSATIESEIKIDKSRGISTLKKEAELAKLNDRIIASSAEIMDKMSEISGGLNIREGSGKWEDSEDDNESEEKVRKAAGSSDTEKKSGSTEKTVIYRKTGEASNKEPEEKVSLLV